MMDSYGFTPFSFNTGRWTILRFGAPPPAADDASCANALMVQSQGLAPLLGRPKCPVGREDILRVHHRGFVANRVSLSSAPLLRQKHQRKRSWSMSSSACNPFSAVLRHNKDLQWSLNCTGWASPNPPQPKTSNMSFGGASCMADLYSSRRYYTNVKTLKVPHVVQVPIPGPPPKVITHKARNFKKGKEWMGCFFFRSLGAKMCAVQVGKWMPSCPYDIFLN